MKNQLNRWLSTRGYRLTRRSPFVVRTRRIGARMESTRKWLDEGLLEPVVRCPEEPDNELFEIFRSIPNVHKWHQYFDVYERELSGFRDRPCRMLEIGVSRGGSLQLWKRWFGGNATIVGIDIDRSCEQYENSEEGIHVRIGDQLDRAFLSHVVEEFGPFDLIIDDGGHKSAQMIGSFNLLFKEGLQSHGLYLVEDTHTNFWPRWINSELTFYEFCEGLVEFMHATYIDGGKDFFHKLEKGTDDPIDRLSMPYIQAWLRRVSFHDSMIVIEKGETKVPIHEKT